MNPVQPPEAVSGPMLPDVVRRILILRHAEEKGREQAERLSSTGRMRAFALPYLLQDISRRDGWPWAPDLLIAAHDTPKSQRPSQNLQHLAHSLSLRVHQCRTSAEVLGCLLLNDPQIPWRHAVVAWRHKTILDVARALGAPVEELPDDWPDSLFDRIIILDIDGGHRVVRTRCVYADAELDVTLTQEPATRGWDAR